MAKLNHAEWPELQQYWDVEYGMGVPFSQCFAIKSKQSTGYAVVAWKQDGRVEMADLSFAGGKWDMINDGMTSITEKDWNKLQLDPWCETFKIPGNPDYS